MTSLKGRSSDSAIEKSQCASDIWRHFTKAVTYDKVDISVHVTNLDLHGNHDNRHTVNVISAISGKFQTPRLRCL